MAHRLLYEITNAGNSAVLIGVVLTAACYFLLCRDTREATALITCFLLAALLITVFKLAFLSCGHNVWHIRSPSGHAALSFAVYGLYPFLLASRLSPKFRAAFFLFFYLLAGVITATRVMLHMHTSQEAVAGALTGLFAVYITRRTVLKGQGHLPGLGAARFNVVILICLTVLVLVCLNGMQIPAEETIGRVAGAIGRAAGCE